MTLPAWGNPWRGLVQAGQISLPGGLTKATTQPEGNYDRHYDELGQTFLQRGPLAGVSRTPEELAADAAAGRTWRTDAILSGARMHLYGKRLDGWVYCAPDGSRWLVDTGALIGELDTSQPWAVELFLQRFGEFQGDYASQTVSVSLADLGQAEPDPAWPIGTQGYAQVCDIRPDGSRALIMLFQPVVPFSSTSGWHPLHKRPLGWLELQLTGGVAGITATLSVVRTRTQSMGSGTWSNYPSGSAQAWIQDSKMTSKVDMGDYWEVTYEEQPLTSTVTGSGFGWDLSSGAYSYSFAGRILALWYTEAGGYEEVTLEASTTGTVSNPPPDEVVSGSMVTHDPKAGGSNTIVSDTRVHTLSRLCTCDEQFSVALRRGGVLVDQSSGTASGTYFIEHSFVFPTPGHFASNYSVTIDGATDSEAESGDVTVIRYTLASISPNWFNGLLSGNSAVHSGWFASGMNIFTPDRMITIDPIRYSNNLIGLRRYRYDYNTATESWLHGPAAYPGGAHGSVVEVSFGAIFGSFNPATEEVAINQSQATCWI